MTVRTHFLVPAAESRTGTICMPDARLPITQALLIVNLLVLHWGHLLLTLYLNFWCVRARVRRALRSSAALTPLRPAHARTHQHQQAVRSCRLWLSLKRASASRALLVRAPLAGARRDRPSQKEIASAITILMASMCTVATWAPHSVLSQLQHVLESRATAGDAATELLALVRNLNLASLSWLIFNHVRRTHYAAPRLASPRMPVMSARTAFGSPSWLSSLMYCTVLHTCA